MQWDSAAYLRFKAERTQPSIDLVKRIDLEQPRKLLDVGCGPGNSTQVLADAFPNALRIIGIDSSPEMIEAAKDDHPDMEFRICDALNLPSLGEDGFDVVFSNACIQWVPDHPRLIRDMLALLRPGGMLAVQVPMNYQEPIHRIIGELAASDEWRAERAADLPYAFPRGLFRHPRRRSRTVPDVADHLSPPYAVPRGHHGLV